MTVRAGADMTSIQPPPGGRAPGWAAGILAARRSITGEGERLAPTGTT